MPLDDADTYAMLCRADTTGVFQLEGGGMRSLIKQLAPDRFEDLMALVALYRPGPLSAGDARRVRRTQARRVARSSYPHPDLEEILSTTYGIMVYQEQVMQIAVRMAGYSMGEADMLRQAHGQEDPRQADGRIARSSSRAASITGTRSGWARTCSS